MISKELLSEVLKIPLNEIETVEIHNMYVYINPYPDCGIQSNYDIYNIHELAYKCKKWAYTKYQILLDSRVTTVGSCFLTSSPFSDDDYNKTFVDETEYLAVFKACEWIKNTKLIKG